MHGEDTGELSEAQIAAIRRTVTSGRGALSRRSLWRAGGGALTAAALGALAGCGIPPAGRAETAGNAGEDHSSGEKKVVWSNWTEYIDTGEDGRSRPTLEAFGRDTGIEVTYTEDINDNVEFFGKLKPQLAAGRPTGRDLICVTDWLAGRLIRLGWARRLDPANLPTAFANLAAPFRTVGWDPGRAHSYPWQGVPTVIAYNLSATGGRQVTSVDQLLTDPRLKGRVALLTEMRDTVGLTLLDMGTEPESFDAEDFDAALDRLQGAVDRGQIRRFTGNDYLDDLNRGNIAACLAWAGDLLQLQQDNPDVRYAVPDAGYLLASDDLLVPDGARHQANAERLIDYYYRPEVAARVAAYIGYVCPVDGVRGELARIDPELARNPLVIPDREMTEKAHEFRLLSAAEESAFEEKFSRLIGA
ncbi:polyamine ABC transporter substrate-binding protein [Streptomyces sp. TP-A0874]|uniref:polyamine ABC transporter substrate-binding protein n=1 Tax=Streptomyces sp. TP-A0874 TaxID=549819 RepID=UPI0008533620|nr:spermidine/putrescine ABC transporter substrate-binding protein [Streptomyces sp. TP-A0874]